MKKFILIMLLSCAPVTMFPISKKNIPVKTVNYEKEQKRISLEEAIEILEEAQEENESKKTTCSPEVIRNLITSIGAAITTVASVALSIITLFSK